MSRSYLGLALQIRPKRDSWPRAAAWGGRADRLPGRDAAARDRLFICHRYSKEQSHSAAASVREKSGRCEKVTGEGANLYPSCQRRTSRAPYSPHLKSSAFLLPVWSILSSFLQVGWKADPGFGGCCQRKRVSGSKGSGFKSFRKSFLFPETADAETSFHVIKLVQRILPE